jgi:hypothetical protein
LAGRQIPQGGTSGLRSPLLLHGFGVGPGVNGDDLALDRPGPEGYVVFHGPGHISAMENPKSVHRFLLALAGGGTVLALGWSLWCRNFYPFFAWLAILALFIIVSGVLALFNVMMCVPIIWLVGKLSDRRAGTRNQNADDRAA